MICSLSSNRRITAEFQRRVVKRGERNANSCRSYAKGDDNAVADRRFEDLEKILPVFDVRPFTFVRRLLNFCADKSPVG